MRRIRSKFPVSLHLGVTITTGELPGPLTSHLNVCIESSEWDIHVHKPGVIVYVKQ